MSELLIAGLAGLSAFMIALRLESIQKSKTQIGGNHVEQSDEYPWGTDVTLGPFSLYFAKKLRANNFRNPVAEEYKIFLEYKKFKIVPLFISETKLDWLSEIIKGRYPKQDIGIVEMDDKMLNEFIKYRTDMLYIKQNQGMSDAENKLMLIKAFSNNSPWIGLRKNPLMWLNVVGTEAEKKFYESFLKEMFGDKKRVAVRTDGYYYTRMCIAFAKLTGIIEIGDVEETDFKDDSGMNMLFEKQYDYALLAIKKVDSIHQIFMKIDHNNKNLYYIDSNGFNYDTSKIVNLVLPEGLSDYKKDVVAVNGVCPKGMFQSISRNAFCQTWAVFLISLTTMNTDKLNDINDINELFKKVIDELKPVCYYNENMTDRVKLSLIIIEYMFYIFYTRKNEFINWLKNKEKIALKSGVKFESVLTEYEYHPDVDLFISSDIKLTSKPLNEYIKELLEVE